MKYERIHRQHKLGRHKCFAKCPSNKEMSRNQVNWSTRNCAQASWTWLSILTSVPVCINFLKRVVVDLSDQTDSVLTALRPAVTHQKRPFLLLVDLVGDVRQPVRHRTNLAGSVTSSSSPWRRCPWRRWSVQVQGVSDSVSGCFTALQSIYIHIERLECNGINGARVLSGMAKATFLFHPEPIRFLGGGVQWLFGRRWMGLHSCLTGH